MFFHIVTRKFGGYVQEVTNGMLKLAGGAMARVVLFAISKGGNIFEKYTVKL